MTFLRVLSVAARRALATLLVLTFTAHSMFAVWCYGRQAVRMFSDVDGHACFLFDCLEESTAVGVRLASTSTFSDRLIYTITAAFNCISCLYIIRGYCEGHKRYYAAFLRGSALTLPPELVLCVRAAWTGTAYELTFVQLGLLLHLPLILMAIMNLDWPTETSNEQLLAAITHKGAQLQADIDILSRLAKPPANGKQDQKLPV